MLPFPYYITFSAFLLLLCAKYSLILLACPFVMFLQVIVDPLLLSKQRSLIIDAARALDKAKMMRFDEKSGNFYCTELGRIASHFYIKYSSVETYNEMLRRHMNDSEVPICFCALLFFGAVCLL